MFRGGVAADPTAIADYDLFAFEGTLVEGRRAADNALGRTLIRVDDTGARPVAWEMLANLARGTGSRGPVHPGRAMDAQARAEHLAAEDQGKRRRGVAMPG